jgi:hypothetical protein
MFNILAKVYKIKLLLNIIRGIHLYFYYFYFISNLLHKKDELYM